MGYEIDFLPVGNSGPGGDAIAMRLGDLQSGDRDKQFVVVVDGGYTTSGYKLVEHIRDHYDTSVVDLVISTHLDRDHIQGLSVVLTELQVRELWMHEPTTAQTEEIYRALAEASGSRAEELTVITASLRDSQDLAGLARDRGIEIVAPYTGQSAFSGAVAVIGPTEDYYNSLVPLYREYRPKQSLASMMASALEMKSGTAPGETLEHETLEENVTTGPENNSSVITLIRDDDRSILLTGDAGKDALNGAADRLDEVGFEWSSLHAMQVPHHGSRNNVTPSVLNRYLGEPVQEARTRYAYISCSPKGGVHHPAKRVTNAFFRRGCKVYKTSGSTKRLHRDAPKRDGYSKAEEVPFYPDVD